MREALRRDAHCSHPAAIFRDIGGSSLEPRPAVEALVDALGNGRLRRKERVTQHGMAESSFLFLMTSKSGRLRPGVVLLVANPAARWRGLRDRAHLKIEPMPPRPPRSAVSAPPKCPRKLGRGRCHQRPAAVSIAEAAWENRPAGTGPCHLARDFRGARSAEHRHGRLMSALTGFLGLGELCSGDGLKGTPTRWEVDVSMISAAPPAREPGSRSS